MLRKQNKPSIAPVVLSFSMLFAWCVAAGVTGCTDEETATRTLSNSGYTEINIKGYSFFGCSQDDFFHTEFSAKNSNGQVVEGIVCSGWLKNGTVRF